MDRGQPVAIPSGRRIALLINADNVSHTKVAAILAELAKYGAVNIRRVYPPQTIPESNGMTMPEAVQALSDPENCARELAVAGYSNPKIESVTFDYELDVAALAEPDSLFGMSPDWINLSDANKLAVIAEPRLMAGDRHILPIPPTALIGVAER